MAMDKHLERLIKYIRREEVVLFIGSGFSLKAGAPRVYDIIDAICKEAGADFAKEYRNQPLRKVSEAFVEQCNSRNDLISLLGKLFQFNVGDTTDQSLLRCIPHFNTIYTSNYDTLLENAYPENERTVITSNAGCSYASEKRVHIYKIHGDITTLNNPDGIIITDSDYRHYFDSNNNFKLIWESLKQSFVDKHVLFIGYSLEDDNVLDIIKDVQDCIGQNMKCAYLVAPNLAPIKRQQLTAKQVTYIDSDANNLLNIILASIKDSITDDVKHKIVSRETYDRFCEINASIFTTIRPTEDGNVIERVDVKAGQKRDEKINFSVPVEKKDGILNLSYNDKIRIPGTRLDIPAIKIPSSEMIDFSHFINGIKFCDITDISSALIIPPYEKVDVKFKVPAIGFVENVCMIRYHAAGLFHIDIETPICFIKMSFVNNDVEHGDIQTSIENKLKYENNNDALKWIDCLIALSQENQIANIGGFEIITRHTDSLAVSRYVKARGYYNLIKKIESDTDVSFESYNQYSDENYQNALYVYLFLTGQNYTIEQDDIPKLFVTMLPSDEDSMPIHEFNKKNVLVCTKKGDIVLNNKTITIPYVICEFLDCRTESISEIEKLNYRVVIESEKKNFVIWCSNEMPPQEGDSIRIDCGSNQILIKG